MNMNIPKLTPPRIAAIERRLVRSSGVKNQTIADQCLSNQCIQNQCKKNQCARNLAIESLGVTESTKESKNGWCKICAYKYPSALFNFE